MDEHSKTLVLYYSRTGTCATVALALGQVLSCPVREIKDLKSRAGFFGFLSGMIDIRRRPITDIEPNTVDLSGCETVALGSPIWGMRFAPAMTTVLEKFDFKGKKIVLFAVVTQKFKQAQIDAYARRLSEKGATVVGSFVIKTRKQTAESLAQQARDAAAGLKIQGAAT